VGLLRAVGTSRPQVRRMVVLEAVLISLFGAALGVALGLVYGALLQRVLEPQGVTVLAIPGGQIGWFLALGIVATKIRGRHRRVSPRPGVRRPSRRVPAARFAPVLSLGAAPGPRSSHLIATKIKDLQPLAGSSSRAKRGGPRARAERGRVVRRAVAVAVGDPIGALGVRHPPRPLLSCKTDGASAGIPPGTAHES